MALCLLAGPLQAGECPRSAAELHGIQRDVAARIQQGILDPILGPGQGSVFVSFGVKASREASGVAKSGAGRSVSRKARGSLPETRDAEPQARQPEDRDFGLDDDETAPAAGEARPAADDEVARSSAPSRSLSTRELSMREMTADQVRSEESGSEGLKLAFTDFGVRVVHSNRTPGALLEAVRKALLAAFPGELKEDRVSFHPAPFRSPPGSR